MKGSLYYYLNDSKTHPWLCLLSACIDALTLVFFSSVAVCDDADLSGPIRFPILRRGFPQTPRVASRPAKDLCACYVTSLMSPCTIIVL
jgi:hypothetical protein